MSKQESEEKYFSGDEKYFSGDVAIWEEEECIDGFTVIFENLHNISHKYMGFKILDCFMDKIHEKYGTEIDIDDTGSENSIRDITLKRKRLIYVNTTKEAEIYNMMTNQLDTEEFLIDWKPHEQSLFKYCEEFVQKAGNDTEMNDYEITSNMHCYLVHRGFGF